MPKSRRNILLDFYLPCAVSGLLLAGLIAITSPSAPPDLGSAGALGTSIVALHTAP
jgi:hypothetical protein